MAEKKTRRNHGYTVSERKDGRFGWAVTIGTDPKTGYADRIQGTCKTRKVALEKALSTLAKVRRGETIPTGKDQTVEAYLTSWMELYVRPHREPKTVRYYDGMIRCHLIPTLGKVSLRKLTAPMLQKVLNDKAKPFKVILKDEAKTEVERTLSAHTVRGIRDTLRNALMRAFKEGLVAENVALRCVTPRGDQKQAEYLTADQAATLIAALNDHPLQGIVTLTLLTGLRVGEATGLRWEDVDFATNAIRVRGQLQRIEGKLTLKRLKSDRANRTLHLPELAIELLQKEKDKQAFARALETHDNPMDLVFLNPEGRPLDQKYVDKHLKAIMAKAELPPMSFHKLRHTAATLALAHGMPLASVRDQLGHSQISLTANTYAHAVPTALKDVGETLARVMRKKED